MLETVMRTYEYVSVTVMTIVQRALEKRIQILVNVDATQFGFKPGRGATGAFFVARKMQEEYRDKAAYVFVLSILASGLKEKIPKSKVDLCPNRVRANSMLCAKCGKWVMNQNEERDLNSGKRIYL